MEEKCIRCILQRNETKNGIEKYSKIMSLFSKVNVLENKEIQKKFNGFYKIRRNEKFLEIYYSFMEKNKHKKPTFVQTLRELNKFGNLEASFASKLLATIDPNLPIWDKYVLEYFNLEAPSRNLSDEQRINQANSLYEKIRNLYKHLLEKEESKIMIKLFDEIYPKHKISSIKKIDFIIWQLRLSQNPELSRKTSVNLII